MVSDVITQLQPQIADAVAAALRGVGSVANTPARPRPGSFRPVGGSGSGSLRPATASYPPAKYQYEYKVADDLTQTYINQQESRDGLEVAGSYSYVDPQGAIVTVNYKAGVDGYSETRERSPGAVEIRPAPPQDPSASAGRPGTPLDIDSLVATVLAALQPQIQQAVQNAV